MNKLGRGLRVGELVAVAVAFSLMARVVAAQSAQTDPESTEAETEAEPRERRNAISLGAAYKLHALNERESTTGERLPVTEHLGGFVIAYERVLIPEHLALQLAKPFLFNRERFDSPFDISVRGLFPKGKWEPLIGLGLSTNVRFFDREREEAEGNRAEASLGILFEVGFAYFFTPKWAIEFELGYIWNVWISTRSGFEHELAPVLGGGFYF